MEGAEEIPPRWSTLLRDDLRGQPQGSDGEAHHEGGGGVLVRAEGAKERPRRS